jgi:hypothetical protein
LVFEKMTAYQTFETQAIYQAIHDLALWLTPHVGKWPKWIRPTLGHQVMEGVATHLSHADTYRLRTSLWNEAKGTLGEYIC